MTYLRGRKRIVDPDPDPELVKKVCKMMDELEKEEKEVQE